MEFQNFRSAAHLLVCALMIGACTSLPRVPENCQVTGEDARIWPDYTGVTVPSNIAPLNFVVKDADECVARFSHGGKTMECGGSGQIEIDIDEWRKMLSEAAGDSIKVQVFASSGGEWKGYKPFCVHVAKEQIDSFVAYRQIPPSYVMYDQMRIVQRDLTSFAEYEVYNNKWSEVRGQSHCVNCHSFQNYHTAKMQMHVREGFGGTLIAEDGAVRKVNLKREGNPMGGAYPAWNPKFDVIAYSSNLTMQNFFTANIAKIEVQDSKSDLVLYDVKKDKVIRITDTPFDLEVFPTWSPDGRWLYYSVAAVKDTARIEFVKQYDKIRYNIYRRRFSPDSLSLGEPEPVLMASADSLSATLPRISPDGKWLLTGQAPYGVFHIWHPEADLFLTNLATGETHALAEANSDRAESFHNWSSNGRWIVFTSRRGDGNFTRLYMAYIDADGNARKAFELPQKNPLAELESIWSYNIPEFTVEKVRISRKAFADAVVGTIF
ncbi:MAG: hypothetical protein K5757_04165 [Bacteroidaceae bacterium]|nr:hypothetical protein [Bacteroidaceae bacterium]